MTELETMQRAKMYVDKLARGIDPITNQPLPGDTALNQVRLSRCFAYVSEVLGPGHCQWRQCWPELQNAAFRHHGTAF